MIQRIQSLYLFAAFILIVLCFFIPVAIVSLPGGEIFQYNLMGFKLIELKSSITLDMPLTLFFTGLLLCNLILVIIFSYKSRLLQIRLCVYAIVFSFALAAMQYWILYNLKTKLSATIFYKVTIVFPLIAGILSIIAMLAIRKDDKMVKSYDRLR